MSDLDSTGPERTSDPLPLTDINMLDDQGNQTSPTQDNLPQLPNIQTFPPGGETIILDSDSDDEEEDDRQSDHLDLGPSADSRTQRSARAAQPRM